MDIIYRIHINGNINETYEVTHGEYRQEFLTWNALIHGIYLEIIGL